MQQIKLKKHTWQIGAAVMENSMEDPKEIKTRITYNLTTLLLGVYTKEVKSPPLIDAFLMFTAALFIMAKVWKQPWYPSTIKWIKKLWCIYKKMEYYSALKTNSDTCFNMNEP